MKKRVRTGFFNWLIHNWIFWILIILNIISIIASMIYPGSFLNEDVKITSLFIGILFWFLIFYAYYLWGDKIQRGFRKGGKILLWISLILFLNIVISFFLGFVEFIPERISEILFINVIVSIFILIFALPIGLAWRFLKN